MLGFAFQKGLVPLSLDSLMQAIEINGVAIGANKRAFNWGRLAAHDIGKVESVAAPLMRTATVTRLEQTFEQKVDRRATFLADYQDETWAARYRRLVDAAVAAERDKAAGLDGFADAVAENFFKLMSYKDEYEVARLYTSGEFRDKLNQQFDGDFKLSFHLAPPLLARRDPDTGQLQKREYGPWVLKAFGLLARMKGLRGTAWDIFGRTEERQMERRLIGEYEDTMNEVMASLTHDRHPLAVQLAEVPGRIKGFGHVKERNHRIAKRAESDLLDAYRSPQARPSAAE
jgi:indolepyruvate ferredoxin oxidoreductase